MTNINEGIYTNHHATNDEIIERGANLGSDQGYIDETTHHHDNHENEEQHHVDEHATEEIQEGETNSMKNKIESTLAGLTILFLFIIGLTANIDAKNISIRINDVNVIESIDKINIIQKDIDLSVIERIDENINIEREIRINGDDIIGKADTSEISGIKKIERIGGIKRISINKIKKIERIESRII